MSEIIKERLKNSEGKEILVFLQNGFRFQGKCLNCDDRYVELLDYKTSSIKIIELNEIKELEVKG